MTKTVYTNSLALPILTVEADTTGSRKWSTFRRYDDDGRLSVVAQPSAVSGYSESYNDLVDWSGGTYIRPADGLLNVTTYYDTTDITNGKVKANPHRPNRAEPRCRKR